MGGDPRNQEKSRNVPANSRPHRCWNCGHFGHLKHNYRQTVSLSGTDRWPAVTRPPGRNLECFSQNRCCTSEYFIVVRLGFESGKGPLPLVDRGAHFSCIRSDVIEYLYLRGENCVFLTCSLKCLLADVRKSRVNGAVKLHVRLLSFSWDYEFKVQNECPFPAILGLDFLKRTQMRVDLFSRSYSFAFAPSRVGSFSPAELHEGKEPYLQNLCVEVAALITVAQPRPWELNRGVLMDECPSLFSTSLGNAKCTPYDNELSDTRPVRSAPYRCAPPKLQIFKQVVNELLEQGVVRPGKSQYASPAFLVSIGGGFTMIVDCRKINSKIVFDSYPMPTIEQAFEQFAGAVVF